MIEALLASEERNHLASAVIDQGPYLSFSREKSPSFADLSREKALPFRIETWVYQCDFDRMQSTEHRIMETFVHGYSWSLLPVLTAEVRSKGDVPGQGVVQVLLHATSRTSSVRIILPFPSQVGVISWFRGCVLLIALPSKGNIRVESSDSPVPRWHWRAEEVSSYPQYSKVPLFQFTRCWMDLIFSQNHHREDILICGTHGEKKVLLSSSGW